MIEEEVYTEALFAKLDEERKTGTLLPLGKDFYEEIEKEIKKQEKEGGRKAETQNKKTTLNKLRSKRTQKILVYLAYNKPLPSQVPAEEEALYYQILKTINKEVPPPKTAKIKILIKIPEIITTKGNKLGPYQEGEVIQVEDPDDAEFMVNNKIGEVAN
jgi:DNA replication initiation complex subunit (GINS family)